MMFAWGTPAPHIETPENFPALSFAGAFPLCIGRPFEPFVPNAKGSVGDPIDVVDRPSSSTTMTRRGFHLKRVFLKSIGLKRPVPPGFLWPLSASYLRVLSAQRSVVMGVVNVAYEPKRRSG